MNAKLETAINLLADKITSATTPDEALKYTQAALNLAHVEATLVGSKHLEKQKS